MAIYDLNRTEINSLLKGNVSKGTENAIIAALKAANLYPSGSKRVWTDEQNGRGGTIIDPRKVRFFFEESNKATVTLKHVTKMVIAAGDGKVTIKDMGVRGGDTMVGGTGKETLIATTGNNELIAGSGRNKLEGGKGHDTMIAGGRSVLIAGSGGDSMVGGAKATSRDTMTGGSGKDTMSTRAGHNLIKAGSGHDVIMSGGHDTVWGGKGHDTVKIGSGASDVFHGKTGHDDLFVTKKGNDTIFGGSHTTVNLAQSDAHVVETKVGGLTKLTFANGQVIEVKNVTIIFSNGHTQIL